MKIKLFIVALILCSLTAQYVFAAESNQGRRETFVEKSQKSIRRALGGISPNDTQSNKLKASEDRLKKELDAIDIEYEKKPEAQLSYLFDPKGFKKELYTKLMNEKESRVQMSSLRYFQDIYTILDKNQFSDFIVLLKKDEAKSGKK